MNFFETIISPFIFFIEKVFLFSYQITGNYGIAIILLSFSVSLLLLPVFIYIEKSKKKDDIIKQKMKPLIDEIKRVYKGQERYYYIKTINRQHNYSSLKALIPILSLLIQIPFFIAAYQYLEHFEGLQGVSFAFIKDLGLPDGLFGDINILPILMTAINLLTAYFYTINGDGKERKQMLVIATAFLILLFDLPAGLVLYWTMNNVFSFIRLFITNPEVFKQKYSEINILEYKSEFIKLTPLLIKIFVLVLLVLFSFQINWALHHSFNNIIIRLFTATIISVIIVLITGLFIISKNKINDIILNSKISSNMYLILVFLVIYFYYSGMFYFNQPNRNLIHLSFFILFFTQILAFIILKQKNNKFLRNKLLWIFYFVLSYQLIVFYSIISSKNILLTILNIKITINDSSLSEIIIIGIFLILTVLISILKSFNISRLKFSNYWSIYILSVIFTIGLILFWKPLIVYTSSPSSFEFPALNIIKYNYGLFSFILICSIVLFILLPKKIKYLLTIISLFLATISFIYNIIIPLNVGSLQVDVFTEENNIAAPFTYYLLESIFIIFLILIIKRVLIKYSSKIIVAGLIILNILISSQAIYLAYTTGVLFRTEAEKSTLNFNGVIFSKTKQNIVYYFADGFQGYFIKKILNDNPKFKNDFSGFTWYPNTLSQSNFTHSSMPSMFGGLKYSVPELNKDSLHTTYQKITKTLYPFIEKIKSKGYMVSSSSIFYIDWEPGQIDNFIPFWDDSWKKYSFEIPLGTEGDIWGLRLKENALFYSIPLMLKPLIYNNSQWLNGYEIKKDKKQKTNKNYSNKKYNFLRLLPKISVAKDTSSSFILIHDETLHNPWNIVKDNGFMETDVTPYTNNKWFITQFVKWIKWMKKNDVYDNTKIILISDHGQSWGVYKGENNANFEDKVDFSNIPAWYLSENEFWRLNALLMVKDFGSKGEIKLDYRMMSNGDAPAIVFDENSPTKNEIKNRILPTTFAIWDSDIMGVNKISIYSRYDVKNNIFDLNNWKRYEN